ncbi:hypothetical protein ACB092_09G088200 [Castanea dentata]
MALRILNSQTRFAVSSQISISQNQTSLSRKLQNAPMDDFDDFDVDPWVESCVREMWNSLNEHQARARSRRLLETFITTYSKLAWINAESVGSYCENVLFFPFLYLYFGRWEKCLLLFFFFFDRGRKVFYLFLKEKYIFNS